VIRHFGTLEADFEREYRLNLAADVWDMSWRRFLVLLRGLSERSSWVSLARARTKNGTRKIVKGAAVDAYFASVGAD
jgi:hypothetical protein